jgi:uncharacterized membrane protein HdeD (DUF308 family)
MIMASGASGSIPSANRGEMMSNVLLAQNWWMLALRGLFSIVFALVILLQPGVALLSFVIFFAAYMLIDGVLGILSGVRAAAHHRRWGLLVLEGIVDILVGIIAFAWPGLTVVFFVTLLAVWSLMTGALMVFAAFKLQPAFGRGWLIFSGLVSVLFGIALIVAPLIGAVVLTWWLGVYALIFGVALLILSFKLRGRKNEVGETPARRI